MRSLSHPSIFGTRHLCAAEVEQGIVYPGTKAVMMPTNVQTEITSVFIEDDEVAGLRPCALAKSVDVQTPQRAGKCPKHSLMRPYLASTQ